MYGFAYELGKTASELGKGELVTMPGKASPRLKNKPMYHGVNPAAPQPNALIDRQWAPKYETGFVPNLRTALQKDFTVFPERATTAVAGVNKVPVKGGK